MKQKSSETIQMYQDIESGYYDKAFKSKKMTIQKYWHMVEFEEIINMIGKVKNKKILDVGCGPGTLLSRINPDYEFALGIDFDKKQINYANTNFSTKKFKYRCLDITKSSALKNNYFDIIILSEIIEHVNYENVNKVLNKAKSLLKKEGILIITTPNYNSFWPIIEYVWSKINPIDYTKQHINKYSIKKLTEQLINSGYKIIKKYTFFNTSPFLTFLNLGLRKKVYNLEKKVYYNLGLLIIIKAKK